MSDIVNDLRNPPVDGLPPKKANAFLLCLCSDAADEITRLRERVAHMESALKNIAETSSSTRIRRLAKEALGKGGA